MMIKVIIILSYYIIILNSKVIDPPDPYTVHHLFDIAKRQKSFVLDSYQIRDAYVNPSIIGDEIDHDKFVMVCFHN